VYVFGSVFERVSVYLYITASACVRASAFFFLQPNFADAMELLLERKRD